MRNLRIGFSKPKKWAIGSQIIQWCDRAQFSHAFLRWYSPTVNRVLVYQASHGMVHFISGYNFDKDATTVVEYEVELSDSDFDTVVKKCIDLAGTKYGTLELLGMGFERITGIKSPFRDGDKTFVCSELVGTVLKLVCNIDLDLELAGPGELEKLISSLLPFKKLNPIEG